MKRLSFILLVPLLLFSACNNKRPLVISKIQSTARLATTETIIDKVVVGDKSKKVFGLVKISNAEFVAYTQARVKTGVDLTKFNKNSVKIKGRQIEVILPPIEVIDFIYSFENFRIDDILSDDDILNRIDVIDQEEFYRQAEIDIRNYLQYMGIVEQSEINTRKLMESLLKNLGYEEIYISFEKTEKLIQEVVTGNEKIDK